MNRPRTVIVFGILNIVWGILGVCSLAGTIIVKMVSFDIATENNPVLEMMQSNQAYKWFTGISTVVGSLATIVILSAGIGLLCFKPWARMASIGWAIYTVLASTIGTIVTYVLIFRPSLDQASGPE